jgi:nucleoside recognition membrane protein YjiH
VNIATPSTLLLATIVTSPALYDAFVAQTMDLETALTRYLIAVPVCGLMLAGLRSITKGYEDARQRAEDEEREREAAAAAAQAAQDAKDSEKDGSFSGQDRRAA